MDLLFSLGFLLLVMILALSYVAAGYALALTPGMVWRRYRPQFRKDLMYDRSWKLKFNRRIGLVLLVASISFCLFNYNRQRSEWMGKNNAHFEAKEYFVVGQILYEMRIVLTNILHPDNPLLWPANWLQHWIFHVGSNRLPEGDGEVGMWTEAWFVHPYSRRNYLPWLTSDFEHSGRMIKLLDKAWFSIETVATKPITDKKMREELYYRTFPGMLYFYCNHEGYYAGKMMGSGIVLARDQVHIERSKGIIRWIYDLRRKWNETPEVVTFIAENPKVEAILQTCLIVELIDVLRAEIHARRFTCDSPYVGMFVQAVNDFGSFGGEAPAFERMKVTQRGEQESQTLFRISTKSLQSTFMMHVLSRYCGKTFFIIKEDIFEDDHRRNKKASIENLYREELEILGEVLDGRY